MTATRAWGRMDEGSLSALMPMLEVAVAQLIVDLADLPVPRRKQVAHEWTSAAVDPLASSGDMLVRRTRPRDGEPGTRTVFAHLARSLAAGAFLPGGVTFGGRHWCADHAACLNVAKSCAARVRDTARMRAATVVHLPETDLGERPEGDR